MADHDGVILNTQFFVGHELEGPRKGTKTLFISGDQATPERIADLAWAKGCEQLYFGSGRLTSWSEETILKALKTMPLVDIALEIHGSERNCVRVLELMKDTIAMGEVYSDRMLVIVTLLMIQGDGQPAERAIKPICVETVAELLKKYPDHVLLKVDTGARVHVLSKYSDTWTNDFSGYGKDEPIES